MTQQEFNKLSKALDFMAKDALRPSMRTRIANWF